MECFQVGIFIFGNAKSDAMIILVGLCIWVSTMFNTTVLIFVIHVYG